MAVFGLRLVFQENSCVFFAVIAPLNMWLNAQISVYTFITACLPTI